MTIIRTIQYYSPIYTSLIFTTRDRSIVGLGGEDGGGREEGELTFLRDPEGWRMCPRSCGFSNEVTRQVPKRLQG